MNRMRINTLISLIAMLVVAAPAVSHAFGLAGGGGKIGLIDPEGGDGAPAVSAHLEFDQPGTAWHMMPSVMFWDSNQINGLSANFDMYYHFVPAGAATPYAGAGVGINHYDWDGSNNGSTRLGLNLFGGLRFPMRASHLFIEGRYTASRVTQIGLLGGVTFLGAR